MINKYRYLLSACYNIWNKVCSSSKNARCYPHVWCNVVNKLLKSNSSLNSKSYLRFVRRSLFIKQRYSLIYITPKCILSKHVKFFYKKWNGKKGWKTQFWTNIIKLGLSYIISTTFVIRKQNIFKKVLVTDTPCTSVLWVSH